jgi:5'-nucleotidase
MRILLTNDDGVAAPGMTVAEEIAAELAGPDGEVWVVAPDRERSGVSHCVSYTQPMRITELAPRRYAVDGYPADCVLIGLDRLIDPAPDLILCGVNRGHNVAEDVVYSGTVGGAMEGGLAGVPSIALSQAYGSDPDAPMDVFAAARALGVQAVRAVLSMPFPDKVFYNVNFPALPPEKVTGFAVCPQGLRARATFAVVPYLSPSGREFFWLRHRTENASTAPGSDARLILDGHVTITPVRPQITAGDLLEDARAALADTACRSV